MRSRLLGRRVAAAALALGACTPVAIAPQPPLPEPEPSRTTVRATIDVDRIIRLARAIVRYGPREATSRAYDAAAAVVDRGLTAAGYSTRVQRFRVPDGLSWGIDVPAGLTHNLVADPPGFDPKRRHLIIGAHLDTVPQAPGANDNASGVAVMLELARLAILNPRTTGLPVRFIAFGAEEPRRAGDDGHHYGSRFYVAGLRAAERRALVGMISLDRVGIGEVVRVCTGGEDGEDLARDLMAAANALDVAAEPCVNRTSDHWSFERNGLPGVRLLGAEHPTYHTARDRMNVLEPSQLRRMTRLAWAAIKRLR